MNDDKSTETCTAPPELLLGRTCRLDLSQPRVMGILNVTPDSFYDGGRYTARDALKRRVEELVEEGSDLIDVGGESTRPGSSPVAVEDELARVIPAVELIVSSCDVPVSIDTTKARVAAAAIAAGAEFVNDISGLQFDAEMAATVADSRAGLFLMHTRGRPETMQKDTVYRDIVTEVVAYLGAAISKATGAGISREKISIDPGIGFGKDLTGNLELLRRLDELNALGRPVLLGTSRKSFIGKILQEKDVTRRLNGSLATLALGVAAGAKIFRVHDVRASRDVLQVAWAVMTAP